MNAFRRASMTTKLPELAAFSSVATHLSFQKAANERGVSRSAISHAIASLERSLGVRLLNRNTRSVSLTDAGNALYDRIRKAFGDIQDALDEVDRFRAAPMGKLRVNILRSIGPGLFGPILSKLTRDHPGLSIEIVSDDRLVDLVAEGFDAGVRFGEQVNQDMIAVKLAAQMRFAVVASPAYAASHQSLDHPAQLLGLSCIRHRLPNGGELAWRFANGPDALRLDVKGPVALDSQDMMIDAALAGAGYAYVFEERVAGEIAAGRLVRRLEAWCPPFDDLYLYYPSRRQVSAGLRALIEALKEVRPLPI